MYNIPKKNISNNEINNIKLIIYACIDNDKDYLNEPIIKNSCMETF